MRVIAILAWKEIRDALRSRWIVGGIALLFVLAMSLYLLGSTPAGAVKASAMSVAVVSLAGLSVYLLPLLALMLSFDAFVGELEGGTLLLLLTYPVRRWQVIAGKLLGHLVVLTLAIAVGYGGNGLIIALSADSGAWDWQVYVAMMGSSVLLGAVYLALGYVVSIAAGQRATAVAAVIGLWFALVVLYDLALLGLVIVGRDINLSETAFSILLLINPGDAYRILNLTGHTAVSQVAGTLGLSTTHEFSTAVLLTAMCCWAVLALAAAGGLFRRREL